MTPPASDSLRVKLPCRRSVASRAVWLLVLAGALLALLALPAVAEPSAPGPQPSPQTNVGGELAESELGYGAHTFEQGHGWLALIGGFLLIGLAFVARSTVLRRLRRYAATAPRQWEEALAQAGARILFVGFLAAGLVVMGFHLTDYFFATAELTLLRDHALNVLLYLALLYVAFELIGPVGTYVQTLTERTETKLDEQLARFAIYALRAVVIVIGVFLLFDLIGAPFVALLVGLAIVTLLMLLVGYDAARNVSSSFQLLADAPFRLGEVIRVNERIGAVRHIGLRATVLETPQRTRLVVPNHELARHPIENLSQRTRRRIDFHLDLARTTSSQAIGELIEEIREILAAEEQVGRERDVIDPETGEPQRDPQTGEPLREGVEPLVVLAGIEPHGLRLHVRYDLELVEYVEAAEIQQALLLQILEALEARQIELVGPEGSLRDVAAVLSAGPPEEAAPNKKATKSKKKKGAAGKKKKGSRKKKGAVAASDESSADDEATPEAAHSPSEANGQGR